MGADTGTVRRHGHDVPGLCLVFRVWTGTAALEQRGRRQLAGLLAYDLVLIVPLVTRAGTVYSGWGINLWAYTVVIVGSGLLAGWYLLLEPHTRMFRARPFEIDTGPGA